MKFQEYYNNILKQQFGTQYYGQKIGIMAGPFRVPYSYDIEVIDQLLSFCSKVVIIISNNSKKEILGRVISKSNLQSCAKLLAKIDSSNDQINKKIQQIKNKAQNITYDQLYKDLDVISKLSDSDQVKECINKFIIDNNKKILSNVKYIDGIQISANMIKEIFQVICQNKPVEVIISKQASPVIQAINFVNQKCKNCEIQLTSLNKYLDRVTTWQALLKNFNGQNKVEEYFVQTKPRDKRQYILNYFNKLSDQKIFGNTIDKNKAEQVRNIINGQCII